MSIKKGCFNLILDLPLLIYALTRISLTHLTSGPCSHCKRLLKVNRYLF